ncbi:MAG: response regulator [Anaerolineae bacterium]|nr:response regulator [Anaerolineae bacterium]
MPDIRVLVADDSPEVRDFVVQCVLEPHGFEALEATDGVEALHKVLEGDIDLMLLDLEMPRMSGLDVLDTLSARRSEIPTVLVTSHGSEAIAVEVFRKGVRDYVIRPFTADEMLAVIERALTEVRLQREKEALTTRLVQAKRQETSFWGHELSHLHGNGDFNAIPSPIQPRQPRQRLQIVHPHQQPV